MTDRNAFSKLVEIVALITRPGNGFTPAPIIDKMPASVIAATLKSPIHVKRSKVRGSAMSKVIAPHIKTEYVLHNPPFESTDKACWPLSSSAPWTGLSERGRLQAYTHNTGDGEDDCSSEEYLAANWTEYDVGRVSCGGDECGGGGAAEDKPMVCTLGWFNLKSMSNLEVKRANSPKKTTRMRAGTMPLWG